jgi:hypothetical protein
MYMFKGGCEQLSHGNIPSAMMITHIINTIVSKVKVIPFHSVKDYRGKELHGKVASLYMWPFSSCADGQQELNETGLQDAAIFCLRRLYSIFEKRALSDVSIPAALQAMRSSVSSSQVLRSSVKGS